MSAESDYTCQKCGHEWEAIPPSTCPKCNPRQPEPKLVRPVKCHFCNHMMYYKNDERFEPEVRVTVETRSGASVMVGGECFYAHVRCWNDRHPEKSGNRSTESRAD